MKNESVTIVKDIEENMVSGVPYKWWVKTAKEEEDCEHDDFVHNSFNTALWKQVVSISH